VGNLFSVGYLTIVGALVGTLVELEKGEVLSPFGALDTNLVGLSVVNGVGFASKVTVGSNVLGLT
jgi:hypothetical protein